MIVRSGRHGERPAIWEIVYLDRGGPGDEDRAQRVLSRALAVLEHRLGGEHSSLGFAVHGLAMIELSRGHLDAALAGFRRARDLQAAAFGDRRAATSGR